MNPVARGDQQIDTISESFNDDNRTTSHLPQQMVTSGRRMILDSPGDAAIHQHRQLEKHAREKNDGTS